MIRIERKAMEKKASEALKALFDRLTNDFLKPDAGMHPLGQVTLDGHTYKVSISFTRNQPDEPNPRELITRGQSGSLEENSNGKESSQEIKVDPK